MTLKTIVSTVIDDAEPQRRLRIAGGAERAAQHEEHHHAEDAHEHRAQERQRLRLHLRRGVHQIAAGWRREPADRGQDDRQADRRQERLIDDAIDLVGLVRAGKPRHEHGHAGEHRADEDDDDDDDLPADADGGVGGVADEMADHRVVDDALQPGDDVLQHRRPRHPPDGGADRALDDRPVEFPEFTPGFGHRNGSVPPSAEPAVRCAL